MLLLENWMIIIYCIGFIVCAIFLFVEGIAYYGIKHSFLPVLILSSIWFFFIFIFCLAILRGIIKIIHDLVEIIENACRSFVKSIYYGCCND